jgi:hypothetical protein
MGTSNGFPFVPFDSEKRGSEKEAGETDISTAL